MMLLHAEKEIVRINLFVVVLRSYIHLQPTRGLQPPAGNHLSAPSPSYIVLSHT